MTERSLPANPHPVPAEINGYPVINYARVPFRENEIPNLAVVLGRDTGRREEVGFAVWNAAVRNGEWDMGEGRYGMSREEAEDYFEQCCKERGAV